MKLDAMKFGLASAATIAALWIICSLLVMLLPGMTMNMGGSMMHADFGEMQWQISAGGILLGLVLWSIIAGFTGWLLATFYNKLV